MTEPSFSRRNLELLWNDMRLVVLDTETLWESGTALPDDAEEETSASIEAVLAGSGPIRLNPASKRIRFLEHKMIEAAGLVSTSHGEGEDRAVEVRLGIGQAVAAETDKHDGRYRAISIALVEVEHGRVRRQLHHYVNPGVPVDPKTFEIHHIGADKLASAPPFPRVAPKILEWLLPASERETVVLVAHNAPYDLGVLQTEFALMDRALPDLPVLDTMGPIIANVGLAHEGGSLDALLAHLGLANADKHAALGDAKATAEAAIAIFRAAAEHGFGSIIELLDAAGNRRSANATPPARIRDKERRPAILVPPGHVATHAVLKAKPTKAQIAAFVVMADGCGAVRCPELGEGHEALVRACQAPPQITLSALLDALDARCRANDGPGANTIIGAIATLYEQHCPMPAARDFSGTYPLRRRETIAVYHRATNAVSRLAECGASSCPVCAEGRACPRYELVRAVAPAVLDPKWQDGRLTRQTITMAWLREDQTGGWFYHRQDHASSGPAFARGGAPAGQVLADAATAALLRQYAARGEDGERVSQARQQIGRVLALGCADPSLIELDAGYLAAPGREDDLTAAINECDAAIANRPTHGDAAWASLEAARDLFVGRLNRIQERRIITPDGEIIPVRRHHPGASARRTRPLRFVVS